MEIEKRNSVCFPDQKTNVFNLPMFDLRKQVLVGGARKKIDENVLPSDFDDNAMDLLHFMRVSIVVSKCISYAFVFNETGSNLENCSLWPYKVTIGRFELIQ